MKETIIQNHAILLKDKVRMDAYKKAISSVVKEGDVVIDIGAGLGVLSFLSAKAGAKVVHSLEMEPYTYELLKMLVKENGLEKKIVCHKKISYNFKIKEKADVIVSEIFGSLGLNENALPALIDARERLLKSGGAMIPLSCSVWFSPAEHKDWEFTAKVLTNVEGFNFLPDSDLLDLGTPSVIIKNTELLAEPKQFCNVDFSSAKKDTIREKMRFDVVRDGVLTGFAGWFETELSEGILFATNPSGLTTHWKQAFLPLRSPQKIKAGQKIELELEMGPDASKLNTIIGYGFEIK